MAVNDPTPNYGFNLPNNLGDDGTWGAILREIFGEGATSAVAPNGGLDKIIKAISDVANAALPKAGGVMTGVLELLTSTHTAVNLGSMTGAVALSCTAGNAFYGTATGGITFSFTNVPATGKAVSLVLEITNGGSQSITWPASVKWPGGSPPTLTTSGRDVITLYTRDGGTTWSAALSMRNVS